MLTVSVTTAATIPCVGDNPFVYEYEPVTSIVLLLVFME